MANTYHQLYIQTVFAVKYREAVLEQSWRADLLAVIGNLINETGCQSLISNGIEDHVHCFFGLKPALALADVMQRVKAKSSKWINDHRLLTHRFEWQTGYGAFSYSHSQVDQVYKYIRNQEGHHKTESFREEYLRMLRAFDIAWDEAYVFEVLI